MNKVRNQLPRLAYIEAQIIHRAAKCGMLDESARAVEQQYELAQGSLGNGIFIQSRIVALLYCLVVVPKELWASKNNHPVYSAITKSWDVPANAVSKNRIDFNDHPTYHFIHHLRNAVSHARFSFDSQKFCFWDKRPNEKRPSFQAELTFSELESLLEVVGSILANLGRNVANYCSESSAENSIR